MNLDRFSQPLTSERHRVIPVEVVEEMRIEMYRDMIIGYTWDHIDDYNELPDAEKVIDFYCHLPLDTDLVEKTIKEVEDMWA